MEERRQGYTELAVGIEKLLTRQESIHSNIIELKEKVKIQNGRIGKLENWRSYMLGALAIISIGMPVAIYMVIKSIK